VDRGRREVGRRLLADLEGVPRLAVGQRVPGRRLARAGQVVGDDEVVEPPQRGDDRAREGGRGHLLQPRERVGRDAVGRAREGREQRARRRVLDAEVQDLLRDVAQRDPRAA
jgi:hypothetical protein